MHKFFRCSLLVLCVLGVARAEKARDIGEIQVALSPTYAVRVTGSTPELENLANLAFNVHGAYKRVPSGENFAINFTLVGANQVRVDIQKGGGMLHSETVTGTSTRNALLRAADVAVAKTSGLRGFFAGRLAFISTRTGVSEVYSSDLFFGEARQVTHQNKDCMTPRWSPDGRKVIYTSYYKSGFPDIYVIDPATAQCSTLVSFKGTNSGGRFSPDGSRVAMVLSGEGNSEVYVGNSAGRDIRRLTRTPGVEASPCFSPDGSRLIFTSDQAGKPQLFVMSVNGGSASRVPTNISNYCAEPDWSRADPNKIVFTAGVGRNHYQVAVFDFSTGQSRIVSRGEGDAQEPVWLADGRHVVYTAKDAGTRSLWILDTESGKSTRLSPGGFGACSQASYLAQ